MLSLVTEEGPTSIRSDSPEIGFPRMELWTNIQEPCELFVNQQAILRRTPLRWECDGCRVDSGARLLKEHFGQTRRGHSSLCSTAEAFASSALQLSLICSSLNLTSSFSFLGRSVNVMWIPDTRTWLSPLYSQPSFLSLLGKAFHILEGKRQLLCQGFLASPGPPGPPSARSLYSSFSYHVLSCLWLGLRY